MKVIRFSASDPLILSKAQELLAENSCEEGLDMLADIVLYTYPESQVFKDSAWSIIQKCYEEPKVLDAITMTALENIVKVYTSADLDDLEFEEKVSELSSHAKLYFFLSELSEERVFRNLTKARDKMAVVTSMVPYIEDDDLTVSEYHQQFAEIAKSQAVYMKAHTKGKEYLPLINEAISHYKASLRLNPLNIWVRNNLVATVLDRREWNGKGSKLPKKTGS